MIGSPIEEEGMEQRDKERLIWNLKSLPHELEDLLKPLDEETMKWRPIPHKWSIKEILCHLRDMERLAYLDRYRRIVEEENPHLPNIDQNRLAHENDYINQDTRQAFEDFKSLRRQTVDTLTALPVQSWQRVGVHDADGPMTIEQLVTRQIKANDLNHMVQMKDIIRLKMPW